MRNPPHIRDETQDLGPEDTWVAYPAPDTAVMALLKQQTAAGLRTKRARRKAYQAGQDRAALRQGRTR